MAETQDGFREALAQADGLYYAGRHVETIARLEPYAAAHADEHWLWFYLARAHAAEGRAEHAMAHYEKATVCPYPFHVGALYELARLDLSLGRFGRAGLLDEALALPGELDARDEAGGQKRFYYDRILFLKALVALQGGALAEAERQLVAVYGFTRAIDERPFGWPWVLAALETAQPEPEQVHLRYLRRRLLRQGMTARLNYGDALRSLPRGARALEIGAMDGVRFDALHPFLKNGAFEAIVVEPLADMFAALSATYGDSPNVRCANVAIAETSGPLRLFRVPPAVIAEHGLDEWVHGVSSAVKGPVLSYLGDLVVEEATRGLSFADFAAEFAVAKFDVLQIDTEGFDWSILKQIGLRHYGVQVAQIEIVNLTAADRLRVFDRLAQEGYAFDYEHCDVVAVDPALARRLAP